MGAHGRLRWLTGINITETLLLFLCAMSGFNFIVLGARPAQNQLGSEIHPAIQFLWNVSLLVFGVVAMVSYFHRDLVTRKLLRLFSHAGLATALLGYSSALIVTVGWTRSSIAIPSLMMFCLMFIGTSVQTFMTLGWRGSHEATGMD